MSKENNCQCGICQVEHDLLDSLSTQTARIHFQALASNHPILNHFDSPADVIARLHDHERVEANNQNAWNGILHALIDGLADRSTEDLGQQLLLVAYTPTIHKVYREICQKFPGLCAEDIAQQAAVCFLETARSPEMHGLNGHLPAALAIRFRRRLFTWAVAEMRQSQPLQELSPHDPEPMSDENFEDGVLLEQLLAKAQRLGVLSETEAELVRRFHCEGCQPEELRADETGPSGIALYYRVQRAVHRLRRLAATRSQHGSRHRVIGQGHLITKNISGRGWLFERRFFLNSHVTRGSLLSFRRYLRCHRGGRPSVQSGISLDVCQRHLQLSRSVCAMDEPPLRRWA